MNSKVRLLSLSATFDCDKTLELVFVTLSLRVKVLGCQKEGEFKEDDRVSKVVLAIAIEQNI